MIEKAFAIVLKKYKFNQSPLFKIRGKGQFKKVTGLSWEEADKVIAKNSYRVWLTDKGREIQNPIGALKYTHERIGRFLSRIEVPEYIFSQKGRSYIDNSRQHIGKKPLIKTDINKFYPSTTRAMIYRMFVEDFECAEDVASKLADLCCFNKEHLPTGSSISGWAAFFAGRAMFDEIAELAAQHNCKMTVYVDDITVSGEKATKSLLIAICQIIKKHGLKTKQEKSKIYSSRSPKLVTGAVIVGDDLRLPNKRYLKIHETRKMIEKSSVEDLPHLKKILKGQLQQAKQILSPKI